MRATNHAKAFEIGAAKADVALPVLKLASNPRGSGDANRVPALRVLPLLTETQSRQFKRIPTHAVGVVPEHREYPRATLKLPLKLRAVNNMQESASLTLVTRDISSTGVYFLCPKPVAVGTSIELEIVLVSRPMGRGNVVATSRAHVQRLETAAMPGWYGIAASFDDVQFDRDDQVPGRFLKP